MTLNRVAFESFLGVPGGTNLSSITPAMGFSSFIYANPQTDYQTESTFGMRGDTNGAGQTVRASGQLVYHDFEVRMNVYRNSFFGSEGFYFVVFQENSGADQAAVYAGWDDFNGARIYRTNTAGTLVETLATAAYNPPLSTGRYYFLTYTYSPALGGTTIGLYYASALGGTRTLIMQALATAGVLGIATSGRQCVGFNAFNVSGVAHRYYMTNFEVMQDDNPPTPPSPTSVPLFPILFAPDWQEGIDDGYEYLTDVLVTGNDGEQRRSLRGSPRRYLRYRIFADGEREVGWLFNLIYSQGASRVGAPLWWGTTRTTATATASATTVALTTTVNKEFTAGLPAVIFTDPFTYEVIQPSTVGTSSLTLSVALVNGWPANAIVAPLRYARLGPQTKFDKSARGSLCDLELLIEVAAP